MPHRHHHQTVAAQADREILMTDVPDGYELRVVGKTATGHLVWRAARIDGGFVGLPRKQKRNARRDANAAAGRDRPGIMVVVPILETDATRRWAARTGCPIATAAR